MIAEACRLAAPLVKAFEGCHRIVHGLVYAYICPAGFPTQGWGLVVPSVGVQPVTQGAADAAFDRALPRYALDALRASPGLAAHPRRLAAVTSFVFNLGAGRYRASTLRRRIDAEDWDGAAEEFGKWVRGGGRVLPGLVKRRAAERALFVS